jgi:cytochrome c peroxidase
MPFHSDLQVLSRLSRSASKQKGIQMDSSDGIGAVLLTVFATLILAGCQPMDEMPDTSSSPRLLTLTVPAGFPASVLMESNPLTEEGVLLGRTLFFDPGISANGKVSCSSCHEPSLAFSDGVRIPQNGVSGHPLHRHSPALFNLAWSGNGLFWDGGSKNLESQASGPLTHADEMGMDISELEHRLRQDQAYTELFESAFGDGVSGANVAKALAQFQRTLISANSRYDQSVGPLRKVELNDAELKGLTLVRKHCAACHSGELFTDNRFHNNGLDADFSDGSHEMVYLGRYRISHAEADIGAFKTPSLRNIMVTAPYMHDGRFNSIDEVLDHYSEGIKEVATTSRLLYQDNGRAGIPLNKEERSAIIAFLNALTDRDFIDNESWRNSN